MYILSTEGYSFFSHIIVKGIESVGPRRHLSRGKPDPAVRRGLHALLHTAGSTRHVLTRYIPVGMAPRLLQG